MQKAAQNCQSTVSLSMMISSNATLRNIAFVRMYICVYDKLLPMTHVGKNKQKLLVAMIV